MVSPGVGYVVKLRCIDNDIVKALRPIIVLLVPRVKVVSSNKHTYRETHLRPHHELKEVGHVLFADTVISEDAMMVHVVNASVASTTMVLSTMSSLVATLFA